MAYNIGCMETFESYLAQIEKDEHRLRMAEVLNWVMSEFPDLEPKIAWNQPMFVENGTFIIGFSIAKAHMAISPEKRGMEHFYNEIAEAGYGQSGMLFRIRWNEPVNYVLLGRMIQFNRSDKKDCKTFWRK